MLLFYRCNQRVNPHLNKSVRIVLKYRIICPLVLLLHVQTAFAEPATHLQQQNHAVSFPKGSTFYSLIVGTSDDYKKKIGQIIHAKFTISNYVYDDLALTYGVSLGHANPKDTKDGFQGGPHIGFRKHFINAKRWSIYIDGSAGAISHQQPLEEDSLRFNFELEAGFGIAYRINKKSVLLGGFRHYHLSNAHISGDEGNVGYDAPMLYLGFMRSFIYLSRSS